MSDRQLGRLGDSWTHQVMKVPPPELERRMHSRLGMQRLNRRPFVEEVEERIARILLWRADPGTVQAPGTRGLSEQLDVALSSVREAVQRLSSLGLITLLPGKKAISEPLVFTRTLESLQLELRAAATLEHRESALRRWCEVERFIAAEALSRCCSSRHGDVPKLAGALEELAGMVSGSDEAETICEQLHFSIWLSAVASGFDPLHMMANSWHRGFPIVKPWIASQIEIAEVREPILQLHGHFMARDAAATRRSVEPLLAPLQQRVLQVASRQASPPRPRNQGNFRRAC